MKNVLAILLPRPAIKSISHTFTNTFSNTFHVQLWRLYSTVNTFVIRLTESFLICISWKLVINHLWSKTVVKLAFSGGYCMNAYDYSLTIYQLYAKTALSQSVRCSDASKVEWIFIHQGKIDVQLQHFLAGQCSASDKHCGYLARLPT